MSYFKKVIKYKNNFGEKNQKQKESPSVTSRQINDGKPTTVCHETVQECVCSRRGSVVELLPRGPQ